MAESPFDLLNRHVPIPRETFERLSTYRDLLLKWQSKINLIGPDTISDSWSRHFLDSLQLAPHIHDLSVPIVDLGSGAGFPGMVMAIYGATNVHLIESDTRKATFLKEVARLTETTIMIHPVRIEEGPELNVSLIVSRACSDLTNLLSLSMKYVSHGTNCLFHKGKNYSKEIETAQKNFDFDVEIFPSVTDTQGVILKLSKLRSRGYDNRGKGQKS